MHSWDVMATPNFDHNWYNGGGGVGIVGTTNIIKNEPQDMTSFQGLHHQITNHNHNSNNQQTESNPTSPQSMDSSIDSTNQTGFYDTTFFGINNPLRPIGFNPLTPPGYPGVSILQQQHHLQQQQQQQNHHQLNQTTVEQDQTQEQQLITPSKNYIKSDINSFNNNAVTTSTLTPSHTPPMDVTPPKSPKDNIQQTPDKDIDNISNCIDSEDTHSMGSDLEDESNMRTPKVNSHGKVKTFKCKQCDFVAVTKLNFWDHTKSHIKPEKMLKCPKCPFVTEYKHHLEYHLRNHDGSKPFQCNQCTYSCVNKSMLNSHLKSHSTIYQYRCQDCNYATKYCHSLKLHLRKYAHKPAMVLNQDGTPNPLPIIDVYGTRRGPKTKSSKGDRKGDDSKSLSRQKRQSSAKQNLVSQMLPNTLANMLQSGTNLSIFPYLNIHMLAAHQQAALAQQLSPNMHHDDRSERSYDSDDSENGHDSNIVERNITSNKVNAAALDLTQCLAKRILNNQIMFSGGNIADLGEEESDENDSKIISSSEQMIVDEDDSDDKPTTSAESHSSPSTPSTNGGFGKNRRKGRAFKLAIMKGLSEDESNNNSNNNNNNENRSNTYKNDAALDGDDEDDDDQQTLLANKINNNNNERLHDTTNLNKQCNINNNNNDSKITTPSPPTIYECKFCEITFKDAVLYTIHMGYHGYNDVFKCNMCGEKCDDRVAFFLHIARNPHS